MRHSTKLALKAALSLTIIAGSTVQVLAEEQAAVPSSVDVRQVGQNPDQPSLAEQYLSRLARTSKVRRSVRGGIYAAGGILFLSAGIPMLSQEEDVMEQFGGLLAVMIGGMSLAAGTLSFVRPSRAERTYDEILAITAAMRREKDCEDALARLARRARKGRMIGGGVLTFLAVSGAASSESEDAFSAIILPVAAGAGAIYLLLVKSPGEKANRAYLEKRALKPCPDLVFGLAPRGGFRIGLSLEF